jgi:hypothetical protein
MDDSLDNRKKIGGRHVRARRLYCFVVPIFGTELRFIINTTSYFVNKMAAKSLLSAKRGERRAHPILLEWKMACRLPTRTVRVSLAVIVFRGSSRTADDLLSQK